PRSDAGVRPHAPALSGTRWRAAHESQVRGRSSLTPRGRYAAPHERAHIHAHLKPYCKGFFRYISALLHCGKTVPRRGSVACSFGCAILGPLRLIFSIGEGAGVPQAVAAGQSLAEGVHTAAKTKGRPAVPAATPSRGSVTPSTTVLAEAFSGWRAPSAASRSTIRPTTASGSTSTLRMPRPRISIMPASDCAGRTTRRPA